MPFFGGTRLADPACGSSTPFAGRLDVPIDQVARTSADESATTRAVPPRAADPGCRALALPPRRPRLRARARPTVAARGIRRPVDPVSRFTRSTASSCRTTSTRRSRSSTAGGDPLGQLQHDSFTDQRRAAAVQWEPAPGARPDPTRARRTSRRTPPGAAALFTTGSSRVRRRRQVRSAPASSAPVLLRGIELVLSTSTPSRHSASRDDRRPGRAPVAVVRVGPLGSMPRTTSPRCTSTRRAADAASASRRCRRLDFPLHVTRRARSGATTALLGFFVDDDYTRFHVVDQVGSRRRRCRAGRDRLPPAARRPADPRPVAHELPHPRGHADDPGRADGAAGRSSCYPAGKVRLTSGILRAEGSSSPTPGDPGLSSVVPSIRVGPVLLDTAEDPAARRVLARRQAALHPADGTLAWRDRPDPGRVDDERLPAQDPHEVQEGWIRVAPDDEGSTA